MSSKLTINWRGLEAAINTAIAKQQNVYLPKGKKEFIVLAAEQATESESLVWKYEFLPEDIIGLELLCQDFAAASALMAGLMAFEKLEAWANA